MRTLLKLTLVLVCATCLNNAVRAQSVLELIAGIKFCRSLKDDSQRLKCFDSLTIASKAKTPDQPKPTSWDINESKSPLDDSPQVQAILGAEVGTGSLILRCKEKRTEAVFFPGRFTFLGSGRAIRVVARIGEGKLINSSWSPSTNGEAAFAPSPIQFIRALPDHTKLFLRAFTFQGAPADDTFALGDVSAVRNRIAADCKWHHSKD